MLRNVLMLATAVIIGVSVVLIGGCESSAQTASAIGALVGAGVGQLAGGDTEASLIGAAVGAGAGYMIGNGEDMKNAVAERQAIVTEQNVTTVWITNSNGSMVPVRLTKNGPGYIGPRGELYSRLPNQDQLRPVYGF